MNIKLCFGSCVKWKVQHEEPYVLQVLYWALDVMHGYVISWVVLEGLSPAFDGQNYDVKVADKTILLFIRIRSLLLWAMNLIDLQYTIQPVLNDHLWKEHSLSI